MDAVSNTLGGFIRDLMKKHNYSNRSLASVAGISEGAVRNLVRYGIENNVKEPEPRTLQCVAVALGVNPVRLFRLAGYLPTEPEICSARAQFVADVFDTLSQEQQDAVLSILFAMAENPVTKLDLQAMRDDISNPLAGLDSYALNFNREVANELVVKYHITHLNDVERIPPDAEIYNNKWADFPQAMQERIKALIRYKLALDYDPSMADAPWRG